MCSCLPVRRPFLPTCRSGVDQQMIAVMCTIERFWRPSFINAVLPVLLVAILGLFSFFTSAPFAARATSMCGCRFGRIRSAPPALGCAGQRALDVRLEIVVTLFLALTGEQGCSC